MKRLTHCFKAYLRYMQISRHEVFVFVEGKVTDPYFYGNICDYVCQPVNVSYEICRSQELSKGNGGKQVLISFFEYLRRKSALVHTFKGKSTGVVFFLDKDVDDFLRTQRRSEHVVYTLYYDVENHIFVEGDLVEATAASASMDGREVLACIGDCDRWRREAVEQWKQWVTLCLFVAKKKISSECNYRVTSRINSPLHGPVDQAAYLDRLQRIEGKLGLTTRQFKRAFQRVSRLIDNIYAQGEPDRVFKGRWYSILLAAKLRDRIGSRPIDSTGLETRLRSNAALTLDFSEPWAEHFKEPLRNLVHQLQR
jgi:hypothetical protein